ncbi:MAG: co-chaperone GroES [Candidatus Berkiella sp.]
MKVIPLLDRVLVKQDDEPQKSEGGIFLPETAKEAPQWGTVVRVGPGKILDNGEKRPMTVKEGDKVIFGKYSGTKVKMGQDELLFMREEDIMAVLED